MLQTAGFNTPPQTAATTEKIVGEIDTRKGCGVVKGNVFYFWTIARCAFQAMFTKKGYADESTDHRMQGWVRKKQRT
jgi:hypothetical protein